VEDMIDFMAQHCFGEYCISLYGVCIVLTAIGLMLIAISIIPILVNKNREKSNE
jgi:hypothetical protein